MKIDLTQIITGIGGKPMPDGDGDMTLKKGLLFALMGMDPNQKTASVEEALQLRRLFDKLDRAEYDIELKSDEVVQLKKVVASRLTPFIAGSVIDLLEPQVELKAVTKE